MTTSICRDTTLHDQIAVAPCSRSSMSLCSPDWYCLHAILPAHEHTILYNSFIFVANALNRERATSRIVDMQVHWVSFPIGPFFMSHNCKLFNPSAGKLTVLHWWLCVQTQGGPVKGGKLRGFINTPLSLFENESPPAFTTVILWRSYFFF